MLALSKVLDWNYNCAYLSLLKKGDWEIVNLQPLKRTSLRQDQGKI